MVEEMAHYQQGPIECIAAMESAFGYEQMRTYCHLNAMKYLWRANQHPEGREANFRKAMYYVNRALSYEIQLATEERPVSDGHRAGAAA